MYCCPSQAVHQKPALTKPLSPVQKRQSGGFLQQHQGYGVMNVSTFFMQNLLSFPSHKATCRPSSIVLASHRTTESPIPNGTHMYMLLCVYVWWYHVTIKEYHHSPVYSFFFLSFSFSILIDNYQCWASVGNFDTESKIVLKI